MRKDHEVSFGEDMFDLSNNALEMLRGHFDKGMKFRREVQAGGIHLEIVTINGV